jgi:hypothetical protein
MSDDPGDDWAFAPLPASPLTDDWTIAATRNCNRIYVMNLTTGDRLPMTRDDIPVVASLLVAELAKQERDGA